MLEKQKQARLAMQVQADEGVRISSADPRIEGPHPLPGAEFIEKYHSQAVIFRPPVKVSNPSIAKLFSSSSQTLVTFSMLFVARRCIKRTNA